MQNSSVGRLRSGKPDLRHKAKHEHLSLSIESLQQTSKYVQTSRLFPILLIHLLRFIQPNQPNSFATLFKHETRPTTSTTTMVMTTITLMKLILFVYKRNSLRMHVFRATGTFTLLSDRPAFFSISVLPRNYVPPYRMGTTVWNISPPSTPWFSSSLRRRFAVFLSLSQ